MACFFRRPAAGRLFFDLFFHTQTRDASKGRYLANL
jgi:hypothetical protein